MTKPEIRDVQESVNQPEVATGFHSQDEEEDRAYDLIIRAHPEAPLGYMDRDHPTLATPPESVAGHSDKLSVCFLSEKPNWLTHPDGNY